MPALGDIADRLGLDCPEEARGLEIDGVAPLDRAGPGEISFLANPRYRDQLAATEAGAVLVTGRDRPHAPERTIALESEDPYAALGAVLELFHPAPEWPAGVHATASIDETARVDETASVAAGAVVEADAEIGPRSRVGPGAVVGRGARIGTGTVLHSGVHLYHDCKIGDDCVLHAGVVIGSDGFGFAPTATGLRKIPQVGGVVVGDRVEMGANTTIDRGTLGDTVIGEGVKLDNLVQIGHNVIIGAHTVIAAQTGIAGSTRIGGGCMIGGQVGIAGHLTIGDGCRIAARTGVMRDVAAGNEIAGAPSMPAKSWLRSVAAFQRLPDTLRELRAREES